MATKRRIPFYIWVNLAAALVSVGLYVLLAGRLTGVGFPLDDAWIHQTYARNLADLGEWSFVPGVTSAGSTSPLWTFLLAILHLVSRDTPFWLTYLLGALALWGAACLAEGIFRKAVPWWKSPIPPAGLLMALEWHLVWAGASGMETLLAAVVVLAVLYGLFSQSKKGFIAAGLLTGIGAWVRPDTLTLLGPLLFVALLQKADWKERLTRLGLALAALALPIAGYLLFNYLLSGNPWPNTFYAKQAEYAALREISLLTRYGQILTLPLVGAGVLLLPGFVAKAVSALRRRDVTWLAAILWWLGYSLIYALQLPVTYQHGRYLIPAMPVYFLAGLVGSLELFRLERPARGLTWALQRAWAGAAALVLAVFLVIGGQSYAKDVAIINSEMVEAALWLNAHTEPDDLIAVHDIGAVGYYGRRKIIDLAGLVTPEVIPFIRDEARLAAYLDQQSVQYLMTFPDWYPQLTAGLEKVYVSGGKFSPLAGGENMAIYRWGPK